MRYSIRVFPAGPGSVFVLIALCLVTVGAAGEQTAGWVEQARLLPSGIDLKAKLDTGAKTSSINTLETEFFIRDGKEQVRFKVMNNEGKAVELVRPLVRHASIRRHFGKSQQRPVVRLTICIGDIRKETEVNLVDREGFNYPLLIGRSYLAGEFLIDSAETFTLKPRCGKEKRN